MIPQILLIEDNPADVRLIIEMTRGANFQLEHRENLTDGLNRLTKHDFSLILLDLSLPDCQGLETFQKTHAKAPLITIVILTGRDY